MPFLKHCAKIPFCGNAGTNACIVTDSHTHTTPEQESDHVNDSKTDVWSSHDGQTDTHTHRKCTPDKHNMIHFAQTDTTVKSNGQTCTRLPEQCASLDLVHMCAQVQSGAFAQSARHDCPEQRLPASSAFPRSSFVLHIVPCSSQSAGVCLAARTLASSPRLPHGLLKVLYLLSSPETCQRKFAVLHLPSTLWSQPPLGCLRFLREPFIR